MELYFKDLISEEASLEKLVDDLARVVQGADDFASAVGSNLPETNRKEVSDRLKHLKHQCHRLKQQTLAGAQATDKWLRKYPYSSLALTFAVGLLIGARACRRK